MSESCDSLFLISGQIGKIKLVKSGKFFWAAQTFLHEGYLLLYDLQYYDLWLKKTYYDLCSEDLDHFFIPSEVKSVDNLVEIK